VKLGRDPAMIRFGRDEEPDYFQIHASLPIRSGMNPEVDGLRFVLSNADGVVYETRLFAGDLKARRGPLKRTYVYRNRAARLGEQAPHAGLQLADLRRRRIDGRSVFTFRLKAQGDFSKATKALMSTQVIIGDSGASLESLWRKTSDGWTLLESDLF
jgi:hypothetical protein